MRKIWLTISAICLVVFGIALIVLEITFAPFEKARSHGESLAFGNALISQYDKFYLYQKEDKAYSFYGKNKDDAAVYVIILPDKEQAFAYYETQFIGEEIIKNKAYDENSTIKLGRINLGMDQQTPIWEVSFFDQNDQLGYFIYSALTGDLLYKIVTE